MRRALFGVLLSVVAMLGWSRAAEATVLHQTCEFRLETWCDIEQKDGPVTIHRARVTTTDIGIRSISTGNQLNEDYLKRIGVQIEFSNEGDKRYKSFVKVRWLDADETAIDGVGDEEGLEARRSHGMIRRSIGALKYGLMKAKTLDIEINLNP